MPEEPTVIGLALVPTPLAKVELVETSNPDGGVTVMPALMLAPETENWVEEEAVPYVVETSESVPLALIVGKLIVKLKVGKVAAVAEVPNHLAVVTSAVSMFEAVSLMLTDVADAEPLAK